MTILNWLIDYVGGAWGDWPVAVRGAVVLAAVAAAWFVYTRMIYQLMVLPITVATYGTAKLARLVPPLRRHADDILAGGFAEMHRDVAQRYRKRSA